MAFHLSSGQVGALGSSSVADLLGGCRLVHLSRVRQMGWPCSVFPACVDGLDSIAAHSGGCRRSGSNAFPLAKRALNAFLATDRRAPATTIRFSVHVSPPFAFCYL